MKSNHQPKNTIRIPIWKNPNIIAIEALIVSITMIYYFATALQWAFIKLILGYSATLSITGIIINLSFPAQIELSIVQQCLFILTPYLLSAILIEITNILVRRTEQPSLKTFLLFTQLSLFSFFMFSLLLFVISLIFSVKIVDSWEILMMQIHPNFQYKILIALSITIVIFGYFGSVLARLKNYFSSQESNNS